MIIECLFADARAGEEGGSTVTFPAGNQIAVNSWAYGTGSGNAGLTISKLIEAKVKLDGAEAGVDPDEPRFHRLLGQADRQPAGHYRDHQQRLQQRQGPGRRQDRQVHGFTFIRTERLAVDGSSYRRVAAWCKSAIGLAIGADIENQVTKRADKRFSWYAYFKMFIGASRLEETKLIEIKCLES